jgi:hypothetical protein
MKRGRNIRWFTATGGAALLCLTIIAAMGVPVMGFGKLQVLFSPVEGLVTLHGKPVAGAEVVQEVFWSRAKDRPPAVTHTGPDGRFSLPAQEASSLAASILPVQPNVVQSINLNYQGKTYEIYGLQKADYDLNSENGGRPLRLVCELAGEPAGHGKIFGLCRFE